MSEKISKKTLKEKREAIEQLLIQLGTEVMSPEQDGDKPKKEEIYENVLEIIDKIDWNTIENQVYGEDTFFNGQNGIIKTQEDGTYWNESVDELIKSLYKEDEEKKWDAGNNFPQEEYSENYCVSPKENVNEKEYTEVRGEDLRKSVLSSEKNLDFTQQKNYPFRLLLPQNKRRAEIEDLNRNFWVIGNALKEIVKDIFESNTDGGLHSITKKMIKEIGQQWENILYLWAAIAVETQETVYATHYEVVYLNFNNMSSKTYSLLKNDNFDNNVSLYYNDSILDKLEYLKTMYPTYNLEIIPVIRFNNYENNYYSGCVFPGHYYYNRKEDKWQIRTFPNILNNSHYLYLEIVDNNEIVLSTMELLLPPEGMELFNQFFSIELNIVQLFNTRGSNIQNFLSSNNFDENWELSKSGDWTSISESNCRVYVERYYSFNTVEKQELLYGMVEQNNKFYYAYPSSELAAYNVPALGNTLVEPKIERIYNEENEVIGISIKNYDIVKNICENLDMEDCLVEKYEYLFQENLPTINTIDNNFIQETKERKNKKGFYRGELLSNNFEIIKKNDYQIKVLPPVKLLPLTEEETALFNKHHNSDFCLDYLQRDAITLQSVLKKYLEYQKEKRKTFWEKNDVSLDEEQADIYSQSTYPYVFDKTNWEEATRNEVFIEGTPFYGSKINWIQNMERSLYKKEDNRADTFYLIEGNKLLNYYVSEQDKTYKDCYYSYDENKDTGFEVPLIKNKDIGYFEKSGAVLKSPFSEDYYYYRNYKVFSEIKPKSNFGTEIFFNEYGYVVNEENGQEYLLEDSFDLSSKKIKVIQKYVSKEQLLLYRKDNSNNINWLVSIVRGNLEKNFPLLREEDIINSEVSNDALERSKKIIAESESVDCMESTDFINFFIRKAAMACFNYFKDQSQERTTNQIFEELKEYIELRQQIIHPLIYNYFSSEENFDKIKYQIILGAQGYTFKSYEDQKYLYDNSSDWSSFVLQELQKRSGHNPSFSCPSFSISYNNMGFNYESYSENYVFLNYNIARDIQVQLFDNGENSGFPVYVGRRYLRNVDNNSLNFLDFPRQVLNIEEEEQGGYEDVVYNEKDIAQMRNGFEVFYNSNEDINIEKYKVMFNLKRDKSQSGNVLLYDEETANNDKNYSYYDTEWSELLKTKEYNETYYYPWEFFYEEV